jgi:hypothetical protein
LYVAKREPKASANRTATVSALRGFIVTGGVERQRGGVWSRGEEGERRGSGEGGRGRVEKTKGKKRSYRNTETETEREIRERDYVCMLRVNEKREENERERKREEKRSFPSPFLLLTPHRVKIGAFPLSLSVQYPADTTTEQAVKKTREEDR